MANTIKEIAERKQALLDRYRSALLEEVLENHRTQAEAELENDRYAWKGEFRGRDEIMAYYKERKRWDRRFLVDTFLLAALLIAITIGSGQLVALVSPKSSWTRGQDLVRQGKPLPEFTLEEDSGADPPSAE